MSDPPPDTVYKILPEAEWRVAERDGAYRGSADDRRDGFIHLSTAGQLPGTAAKYFRDQQDLLLVAIDAVRLGPDLRWETSRAGALFPHLYAPLDITAAVRVEPMPLDAAGIPTASRSSLV